MLFFRRIINSIILVFAIVSMVMIIYFIVSSYDAFDSLVPHNGVVEAKHFSYHISSHRNQTDSDMVFNFKVGENPEWFTVSRFAIGVDNLVEIGDSVEFYTKKVTSRFGNMVSNGKGISWNTHSPNEVYHMVSKKYPDPVVDFDEYKSDLKISAWWFLFLPVALFGWYLYRRSGRRSPFVSEYSNFG